MHDDATNSTPSLSRRGFLAGATASTFAMARTDLAPTAQPGEVIKVGVIGCGGRGSWIAPLFQAQSGYRIVSAGDYFDDRVQRFGERFGVPAERRHKGLANFRRVLDDDVDAVIVQSPPYFHPAQCAAAIEAGKHVFLAKPVAVDVPGCQSITESGARAEQRGLVFLVDFQTRADETYQEAVRRVGAGDIGTVINGQAAYACGFLFGHPDDAYQTPEGRLRRWQLDRALSGDIITEQHIHALDVACWFLGEPLAAVGEGGRKLRKGDGVISDHMNLVFTFPGDVPLTFTGRQFGKGPGGINCRLHGSQGTVDTNYFGSVEIFAEKALPRTPIKNLFKRGTEINIARFHAAITAGHTDVATLAPSVRSNLMTILGRSAAERGQVVTWKEMMENAEQAPDRLKGLKA